MDKMADEFQVMMKGHTLNIPALLRKGAAFIAPELKEWLRLVHMSKRGCVKTALAAHSLAQTTISDKREQIQHFLFTRLFWQADAELERSFLHRLWLQIWLSLAFDKKKKVLEGHWEIYTCKKINAVNNCCRI